MDYLDLFRQVIQFKGKYPDIVLLIEVGYKYWHIAGQVLGFLYGMDRNFLRTSCPEHNLKVNIKKLVAAGYKVGVISQIETAALKKVGDNRNTLFERKLTALYTPSTFVDDLDAPDDFGQATPPLMVIVEDTRRNLDPSDKVLFGIVSIVPSTGDVVYDEFQDTLLRTELETRLAHTRPSELLLPSSMSTPTEKILCHFIAHGHSGRVRTERINHDFDYSDSFDFMAKFYGDRSTCSEARIHLLMITVGQIVSSLAGLPKQVVIALALAVKHLLAFGLSDALLQIKYFHPFATRAHMLLDTSTIRNLEVYRNQTDFTEKGTLFAVLNRTTTMFGKRLLKSWVGRPLIDATILQHRVDAVEEARLGRSPKLIHLRDLLKGLPDLARGLCRIQYGRCTPKELVIFLLAMNRVASTFPVFSDPAEVGCLSPLWIDILFILPSLKIPMKDILAMINLERARENDKTKLWTDIEKYPSLDAAQTSMMFVDGELAEQLKKLRKTLGIPGLRFVNILSDEYLIELPKERAPKMPLNWVRMGSTKTVVRFRTPEVAKLLQEREQHKETLLAEADQAYKAFLQDIASQHYALFRDVVNKLATADCLMSLAIISLNGEYCKPNFVNEVSLSIVGGRHPIIEQMRPEPFIPNTISLGGQAPRSLVISGPNMGGKTSTVKLVALLLLMAQIGSYVPATSMSLSMHDAIFTRMGASDDLAAGRSTFMVEIAETREIIKAATPNSLVVLDELGVGTSTYDGMAIAGAVLEYLCREIKCQTLFITHYPALARELEAHYPGDIGNRYMDFREDTRIDGRREIRFLYLLADGISKGSFGIECARLAGLPESVLREATSKAETMQGFMEHRSRQAQYARHWVLFGSG
ncbi:hypothetical protein K439DRAFT_1356338 [Ramaria rubella]|nr:hypothetical protein K439DRAFT_1356338 [Ramaria rubella]